MDVNNKIEPQRPVDSDVIDQPPITERPVTATIVTEEPDAGTFRLALRLVLGVLSSDRKN